MHGKVKAAGRSPTAQKCPLLALVRAGHGPAFSPCPVTCSHLPGAPCGVAGCSFSSTPSSGCARRDNASQCIMHSVSFLNLLKEALRHNAQRQRADTSGAAAHNLPMMPPAKRCVAQPAPAPGQGGQGDGSCTGEPGGSGAPSSPPCGDSVGAAPRSAAPCTDTAEGALGSRNYLLRWLISISRRHNTSPLLIAPPVSTFTMLLIHKSQVP